MKIGDPVEIIPYNFQLQPATYKTCGQYGRITEIDGAYIRVRPKWQRWESECYPEELTLMNEEDYKIVRNYKK